VADEVLQHIDIREEGKENDFSLGRSLWIAQEVSKLDIVLIFNINNQGE